MFRELAHRPGNLGTDWSWAIPTPKKITSTADSSSYHFNDYINKKTATSSGFSSPFILGRPSGDGGPCIGINLRPWVNGDLKAAAQKRFKGLSPGERTVGIAAREEDARLLRQLFPGIPVHVPEDFSALLTACMAFDQGWAMRYHVVLAMLRTGVAIVPLPYDEKVRSLCREAGIETQGMNHASVSPQIAAPDFMDTLQKRFVKMKTAFLEWQ